VTRRLLAALALTLLLAPAARASVEEFSSFDVGMMEDDDENFLDHWLTRPPDEWRDEFEAAPNAFRTSQGCYTAGLWYLRHDLKARASLGGRAYLDLGYLQVNDDDASWQWLRLDFRWATKRTGTFGLRFQPSHDKSQQDFAALWDWGAPNGPLQVGATFTLEDAFNSLWEFRQARVGNHNEPYRAHPVEPALRIASEGRHHRFELNGKWLTPLSKDIHDPNTALEGSYALWGAKGAARTEFSFEPWGLDFRFETTQARSSESALLVPGDGHVFRRRWQAETALRRSLGRSWHAEARLGYEDRAQDWRPQRGAGALRALDRGRSLEVSGDLRKDWRLRVGLMHDRVGIAEQGWVPVGTWGTRKESRAYVGLQALFGRVRVQGIEGIELDHEAYEVTFHHDKGFVQLQTTF
jgi:hypothetical protein